MRRLSRIGLATGLAALVTLVSLEGALAASVRDRGGDVRAVGSCSGAATSKLRLRARDGSIEAEFEVEHAAARKLWRVTLVHERRVVWRGARRTTSPGRALEVDRRLPDLVGADTVTVSAWGPAGTTCRVTAVLRAG